MSFFSSFILISLIGILSHYFYRKYGLAKGHLAFIFYYGLIAVGGILIVDVLIYQGYLNFVVDFLSELPWINIENGRDFMWNAFQIFNVDWEINYNDTGLNYIALLIFISYPIWYMTFKDISRKFFGGNRRRPHEKGLAYLFTPTKKPNKEEDTVSEPKEV